MIREDLCAEAMRLTYLLIQHEPTRLPKVEALMALMCLQSSRFAARTGHLGEIILLEDQDRSLWSKPLIRKGLEFLEQASVGDTMSEYHVEASIASVHALAPSFAETHWNKLVLLYQALCELKPSAIVSLNKAIAIGYATTPQNGISALQKITDLTHHHLYLCALGNFYFLQGHTTEAKKCFEAALQKTSSTKEAELIKGKVLKCKSA
jgi:predicted RNA polymerase sigma factor